MQSIFTLLARYPLLTFRKQCQLQFAQNCLKQKTPDYFLKNRDSKYNRTREVLTDEFTYPPYFSAWLSGFIEAEGNFSLTFNEKKQLRKSAFCIGQNDDLKILNMIKFYFKSENQIYKDKKISIGKVIPGSSKTIEKIHYRLYLYNADSRKRIFEHFNKYPLLGQKIVPYTVFFDYHSSNTVK